MREQITDQKYNLENEKPKMSDNCFSNLRKIQCKIGISILSHKSVTVSGNTLSS